ncbi:LysR family transcriptional regulator [Amphritea japonica]|uniref:LysR family transcriptional regulator, transcriptional activator AphB n=1 Tax=Amphritea japonica ATCC BAA-1530 TaxID=1278309 RepID=A0A7R6SUD9_9GAMM|nr:LysR family transcriptional regulator [Amphritea japonica]BBB27572.1 LysR family transcriptional regulator, transcriptional activator AphB [Amphritea japonica ATCC BAA-1530]
MNYQDLFIFLKVVERGSFVGASALLDLPTSTVSRKVMQLEKEVGYRLMHRSARKLVLTEAGEKFFNRCQPLYNELEHTAVQLNDELADPAGLLRVTAPVSLTNELLGEWFFQFMERFPRIQLDLMLVNRNVDLVEEGVDVAFRIGDIRLQNWISRPLMESTFSLCASEDYLLRRGMPQHPDELYQHTLIVPRRISVWHFDGPNGQKAHIDCTARLKIDELKLAARAAEEGLGIVNLPDYVLTEALEEGRLKRLMPDWRSESREVHLLYQERRYIPGKVRVFIEFIMARFDMLK